MSFSSASAHENIAIAIIFDEYTTHFLSLAAAVPKCCIMLLRLGQSDLIIIGG